MKKQSFLLCILGIVLFFNSCAPVYIPNTINSPLFSNKGEFHANIGAGKAGIDAQVAYAVTDHIGVMVNSNFGNNGASTLTSDTLKNNYTFFEGGVGYYAPISDIVRFECYGGFGIGNGKGNFRNSEVDVWYIVKDVKANYSRIFLQPAIGLSTEVVDLSLASRLSFVDMTIDDAHFINTNGYSLFLEPALTAKVGFKYVKFFGQIGVCMNARSPIHYEYQHTSFTLGTQITIGRQ